MSVFVSVLAGMLSITDERTECKWDSDVGIFFVLESVVNKSDSVLFVSKVSTLSVFSMSCRTLGSFDFLPECFEFPEKVKNSS